MDFKHILELIDRIEASNITNFELTEKEFQLKLGKDSHVTSVKEEPLRQKEAVDPVSAEKKTENVLKGNLVTAPIVGTFYRSSSPETEPFVQVGQTIQEGDVVCIIEAMKLFNEVQSDFSGVVKKILVQDGDLLEYGQPIMIIE